MAVRLRPFTYHQPETLDGALALLSEHGDAIRLLAGGTELLLLMKMGLTDASALLNLKRIQNLRTIALDADTLRIGALVTHGRIADHPLVRLHAPALAELCGALANARVRSTGTIGGNLCFAEPRADPPVLLAALGASVELVSEGGSRRLPVEEFVLGPMTTAIRPTEVLKFVTVPTKRGHAGCVRLANGSHSLATAAVLPGSAARVWAGHGGGMGPLPACAEVLNGRETMPDETAFAAALSADIRGLDIITDIEASEDYRRHLVGVAVRRAVTRAFAAGAEVLA